jgi:hypothetical protein
MVHKVFANDFGSVHRDLGSMGLLHYSHGMLVTIMIACNEVHNEVFHINFLRYVLFLVVSTINHLIQYKQRKER